MPELYGDLHFVHELVVADQFTRPRDLQRDPLTMDSVVGSVYVCEGSRRDAPHDLVFVQSLPGFQQR